VVSAHVQPVWGWVTHGHSARVRRELAEYELMSVDGEQQVQPTCLPGVVLRGVDHGMCAGPQSLHVLCTRWLAVAHIIAVTHEQCGFEHNLE
jgi:hypothetical protein